MFVNESRRENIRLLIQELFITNKFRVWIIIAVKFNIYEL